MVTFEKYATKCIKLAFATNEVDYYFRNNDTPETLDCIAFMLATGCRSYAYENGKRTKFLKNDSRSKYSDETFAEVWGFTKPEFLLFMFDIEEKEYKATIRKIVNAEFENFKKTV